MTKEIFTMGANERNVVAKWYLNKSVTTPREARALLAVKAALDEVFYDYKVTDGEAYTDMESILYIAYNVAIGKCSLEDVFDDLCIDGGGAFFRIISTEKGFTLVNA